MLNFVQTAKQVLGEPIIPHRSVVAFNIGVLLRVSGLGVNHRNSSSGGPLEHCFTDVFRAIVAS